jgi:hypothetical protein
MSCNDAYIKGQWEAFNKVLTWINEQDLKHMSKGDLYDAVMDMRPTDLVHLWASIK